VLLEGVGVAADGSPATLEVVIDEPSGSAAVAAAAPIPEPWVLLPSSLRNTSDLGELATHLAAKGFRVLRPTPRGMGRSSGSLEGLTLHLLAADIAATIRALGQGRPAILLGHAAGHFVARVVDLDYPALVRGIVVAAAAARVFPPEVANAVDLIADHQRPRAERLMHLRRAFFASGSDPRPWLEGWYPALGPAYRAAARVPGKARWWPVSHAPILDLQAADDPWRPPATRQELKDVLGDLVTVRVIDGASHALPYERPDAVVREVIAWRRTLDGISDR
jgi:pimeloyl-ACP methyl ester carboxylesterase